MNRVLLPAILLAAVPQLSSQTSEPGRWAFSPQPDEFRPDAILDLRYLNETTAGESGFLGVNAAGDFVLGNGKAVRFWAVNTTVQRERPFVPRPRWRQSEPDLERHARFLAKRGVNMVRLHAHVNPNLRARPDAAPSDIDEAERDWIWRTVAAMKKQGIYTTISPYWANTMQFSEKWNVPGGHQQSVHGLLFFDEWLQDAFKAWLRALFAEVNPYTGLRLADDPAVGMIHLQNEDSLLFWTVNNLRGPKREDFARQYYRWIIDRYGSIESASRAWSNNRVQGDDPAGGILEFHNLWEMTQNRTGGFKKRLDDQLQFWSETMFRFHSKMAAFLKEDLGCRQLLNAGNWKSGDVVRLNDAERWTYTANDVIAVNRYFAGVHNGPTRTWAIVNNDEFTSPSVLLDPRSFPLNLKQVRGYPMMVTESSWVMPMAYSTEGPFLVAAYQSLTGIDGFFWFSTGDEEWTPPQSANGFLASQQKWLFGNPDMLGTFPAAALLYRMGYVAQGEPVLVEERALQDLWERRTPVIAEEPSFDPNRDAGDIAPASNIRAGVSPLAFLAGPVQVVYGGDPSKSKLANLEEWIRGDGKGVVSNTGQLEFDSEKGYCSINAPKAQGVAAFFENRREFALNDVFIRAGNRYGSALVVSMDGRDIKESRRILVQVGTRSRPTGWREEPAEITLTDGQKVQGFRVADYGRAPWSIENADVDIRIWNPLLTKATVLDMNGNARGTAELIAGDASVQLRFPAGAMHVVLE